MIITALQEEIAAAQKKLGKVRNQKMRVSAAVLDVEEAELSSYIKGLNMALYLLTTEPVKELEY